MSFPLAFAKYQGTGNDFILIDSRKDVLSKINKSIILNLCNRKFGIGADGLILLKSHPEYDFEMDFYNSDGNKGSMCGNGGRCIVAFAHDIDIIKNETTFWAPDGVHKAFYHNADNISLLMSDVEQIDYHSKGMFINTGSPHLVIFNESIDLKEVYKNGKAIRYSEPYAAKGTNVNFIQINHDYIEVATYERGVEDVTLSCGTGTVASAIAAHIKHKLKSPVKAVTPGGELSVEFSDMGNNCFTNIFLIGPAKKVFEGIVVI
jgi:diaminopimelate epimerase